MGNKELTEARHRLHHAKADMTTLLESRGDWLAKQNGWDLDGLDAIRYHLMQVHHWTPAQLFAMSDEHLHFAMTGEPRPKRGK